MKRTLLILLSLLAVNSNAQVASFSLSPSVGSSIPHTVFFTDQSTNPDTWLWNFGDGSTSTAQNPIHTYTSFGEYTISLTIQDTMTGVSDVETKVAGVKISAPVADIGGPASGYFGCAPLTINFIDASLANGAPIISWLWNFGDGTTSTNQTPSHTYNTAGIYTVTLTVTDSFGNTDTGVFTNRAQAIGPDVSFSVDQTQICPNTTANFTDLSLYTAPVTSWIWDFGDGSPTSSLQNANHTYLNSGIYSVSLTISDLDGCSRTYSINDYIFVGDTTPPTLNCPANISINTDAGLCTSTPSIGIATGTDNCGSPIITNDAPASFPIGNTTVTWTSTDAAGNFVTCNQIVTVLDNEDPTISCPADIIINSDAGLCTSTVSIGTATGTDNCGSPTITNDAPAIFPIGNITVTWTSTDAAGNFVTCTQEVTVLDNENPTISCPADITINTDSGLCTSTSPIGTATGTDNCGTPTITNDAPAIFPIGNTTVTWTSTDAAGNFVTCSQVVTVVDDEDPTISCPADILINSDAGLCTSTASIGASTGTDNCGSPTIINNAPANFPIGNTTVTYTATDAAGNFVTCQQIVTVLDNEDPTITCPADITINTDAGQCTSTSAIGTATGTDNCSSPTIINDAPANFPIGNTTVTWTSTDASGNFVTCTQVVTVVDNENPTITCPSDITIYADNNCDFTLVDYTTQATSIDNCTALSTITQSPVAGSILNGAGIHVITLNATDDFGNTIDCTFEVNIIDTISPVVECLSDQTEVLDELCQFVVPDYGLMTNLTDNCSGEIYMTQAPEAGTVYDGIQDLPVILTFEDASGNITTCNFEVDVITDGLNAGCLDDIFITTLLTPNGDGRNDTWLVRELDFIKDCTVQVFNRWGQKVYETINYQNDWNGEYKGELLPDGAYVYVIICNDEIKYSGPLMIMSSSN